MRRYLTVALLMLLMMDYQVAFAARSYICGAEMGSLGEFFSSTGTASIQGGTKRTGGYAIRANPTAGTGYVTIKSVAAGGTPRDIVGSIRFYLYVTTLPDAASKIMADFTSTGTLSRWVRLETDGRLTIGLGASSSTGTNTVSVNTWYLIDVYNSFSLTALDVDGIRWRTVAASSGIAHPEIRFGLSVDASPNVTGEIFIDDILLDDSVGVPAIGAGQSILVLPTTDPGSLNSWTGGAGGTSNLWDAVNNIPPQGDTSSSNVKYIKNAASGGNLDYIPTAQTYATAGVGASDTVNAVMAITNDCEAVSTATKVGGVWINANPAQTAGGNNFDYGNDTATTCGTFPSGWATHFGSVSTTGITIGSAPTVAVRKTTSTTRVVDDDFLAIYVDYVPFVASTCSQSISLLGVGCR
jgi:hypothetical protein